MNTNAHEFKLSLYSCAFVFICGLIPATAQTPILSLTATTDNDSVRIDVLRWTTDAERDPLLLAWTQPGAGGGRRAGGRGPAALDPDDPALAGLAPTPAVGGRGGRGGGAAPHQTPEASLTAALGKSPTVGYLWTSEVAGYALHYAVKLAEKDGSERIILITDRHLGDATNYEFSVVELHLNSKDEGEGKISLTGKVAVDASAKTIALENYGALPAGLKNVRRRSK